MDRAYRMIGYAYASSELAAKMCSAHDGCWYYETLTANCFGNNDFVGPFVTAREALDASRAAYPHLPTPPHFCRILETYIDSRCPTH